MLPAICILGAGVLVLVLTLVYCLHSSSKPDEVGERIIIEYTEDTDLREITALIEKCGVDIQYIGFDYKGSPDTAPKAPFAVIAVDGDEDRIFDMISELAHLPYVRCVQKTHRF